MAAVKETRLVSYKAFEGVAHFAYRPDAYDKAIFGESKAYRRLALRKTDKVLDVGAHIGIYTVWAAQQALGVIAYEPEPTNLVLLRKNTKQFKNVVVVGAAVVGAKDKRRDVDFYVQGANTVGHSIHHFRGRDKITVPATGIDLVLKTHGITVLKLDCEGAEYPIILDSPLPKRVRAVVMEMHFGKQTFRGWSKEAHAAMLAQGFTAVHPPNLENRGLWHTNAVYER